MAKKKWKPPSDPEPDYDLLIPFGDLGILSGATSEMLAKKGFARWWAFNGEIAVLLFVLVLIIGLVFYGIIEKAG